LRLLWAFAISILLIGNVITSSLSAQTEQDSLVVRDSDKNTKKNSGELDIGGRADISTKITGSSDLKFDQRIDDKIKLCISQDTQYEIFLLITAIFLILFSSAVYTLSEKILIFDDPYSIKKSVKGFGIYFALSPIMIFIVAFLILYLKYDSNINYNFEENPFNSDNTFNDYICYIGHAAQNANYLFLVRIFSYILMCSSIILSILVFIKYNISSKFSENENIKANGSIKLLIGTISPVLSITASIIAILKNYG
jgi:hypothetical protein